MRARFVSPPVLLAFFLQIFSFVFVPAVVFTPSAQAEIYVRMETVLGNIDIELYGNITPITVANFLNYVDDTDYDNSFIHLSHPSYQIIQGGGFKFENDSFGLVPLDSPIVLEYNLPNRRGTIAMARGTDPDTATSQWFFNLADN